MLKFLRGDLHIHTCLSPCGDYGMTPGAIVEQALARGLDFIGVADHNCAANARAVIKAGKRLNLEVLGGMEITSQEEVHVLAFFDQPEELFEMAKTISHSLEGVNDEEAFGKQIIINEHDEPVGVNRQLLSGAVSLTLEELLAEIHRVKGVALAAHVDRGCFSVISQLGFIPRGMAFDALEISPWGDASALKYRASGYPLVKGSDAHYLADIGKSCSTYLLKEASVAELRKAFRLGEKRRVIL